MKRVKKSNPAALSQEGALQHIKGDYIKAFDCYTKATELGDFEAHCKLACMYQLGHGVEKNKEKFTHHLEEAAIGGHPFARYNLGREENKNGNIDRAVKHWKIAATQGQDESIKELMNAFKLGYVSKGDLVAALFVRIKQQ